MMALEGLQSVGASVVGVIVNDIPRGNRDYGYGKYGTYGVYGASTTRSEKKKEPVLADAAAALASMQSAATDPSELPPDAIVLQ